MYTVQQKGGALVWDKDKNRLLAQFTGGVFMTGNKTVADALAAVGYVVEPVEEMQKRQSKNKG